jgi:hypothetical protein
MRTSAPDDENRHDNDEADDDQQPVRESPRREGEPDNERQDDDRHGNGTSRSPLRHGVQHVRGDVSHRV